MNHDEWLAERRKGIGGSDAPAVCSMSPWGTPFSVYLDKLGQAPPTEATSAMRRGLRHEEAIGQDFTEETGIEIRRPSERIVRHPSIDWLMCSPDFLTTDETAVVQCKMPGPFAADKWGASGTDQVPDYYAVQVQHEMAVTGAQRAYIPALFHVQDFRVFRIERNDAAIQWLLAIEADFWRKVLQRMPPEPSWEHPETHRLVSSLFGLDHSLAATLGADALETVQAYENHAEMVRVHVEGKAEAKARLLFAMGEAGIAYLPDGRTLTRKKVTRKAYEVAEATYVDFRIRKAKVKA